MNYRKTGKARWVYECAPCGYVYTSVDEFGAYAAEQDHRNSPGHTVKAISEGFKPFAEAATTAFRQMAAGMTPLFEAVKDLVTQLGAPVVGQQWQAKFIPERVVTIKAMDFGSGIVTYGIARGVAPSHTLPLEGFMKAYQKVDS